MKRPALAIGAALLALASASPAAEDIVRRVGRVTIRVDTSQAFPGGVVAVRLASRARLGAVWALLEGRRVPFHSGRGGPRALVPVAATSEPGPVTLGVAIAARTGEQRVAIPVTIRERAYPTRTVALSEEQRGRLDAPETALDGRRLLAHLRAETDGGPPDSFTSPVGTTGSGFGELRAYTGGAMVESRTDGLQGERHRGLDFAVPVGTLVRAPAAGQVVLAGPLALTGETVVIDHGQGIVSVLQHLSRLDVSVGDVLRPAAVVGLSGQTGLAPEPLVEWRVYLHGVAVDPLVLGPLL